MAVNPPEKPINIKDLVLEGLNIPEAGPFDPNDLIDDGMWKLIEKAQNEPFAFINPGDISYILKILDPTRSNARKISQDIAKIRKSIEDPYIPQISLLEALMKYKIRFKPSTISGACQREIKAKRNKR